MKIFKLFSYLLLFLFIFYCYNINYFQVHYDKLIWEFFKVILIIICLFYFCLICKLLRLFNFISFFWIEKLFTPFIVFDTFLKHNKKIFPWYNHFLNNFIEKYLHIWGTLEIVFFISVFYFIPCIMLLLIFFTDVFFVGKIQTFYYFIFLMVFPYIYRYFIYSLQFKLEDDIKYLEKYYSGVLIFIDDVVIDSDSDPYATLADIIYDLPLEKKIYNNEFTTIKKFLEIQRETFWKFDDIKYKGVPMGRETYWKEYQKVNNIIRPTEDDKEIIAEKFFECIPRLLILTEFIDIVNATVKKYYIPQVKLGLAICYLFCWFCVLLKYLNITIPEFVLFSDIIQKILIYYPLFESFPISNTLDIYSSTLLLSFISFMKVYSVLPIKLCFCFYIYNSIFKIFDNDIPYKETTITEIRTDVNSIETLMKEKVQNLEDLKKYLIKKKKLNNYAETKK